jgi:small subunit ribosomal protein S3Ae
MSQKARKKGRGKTIDKWKTKEWYEVYAPKTFKEASIGSIPSSTPENLIGRVIEILLYDLTGNFKHTSIKLKFKISEVIGQRCNTRLWGHELTRDFIRSLIHRGSTRIDGIFNYTTADGFIYRVSTFVVSRKRTKQSQKKTIRKIIFDVLNEFAKNMTHDKFVRGIIFGKFASNISRIAKTIYPLRECQVRKIKVISMPEGIEDELFTENDEEIDEVDVTLKEHGKSLKSKKLKRKKEQDKRGNDVVDDESEAESESDAESVEEITEDKKE